MAISLLVPTTVLGLCFIIVLWGAYAAKKSKFNAETIKLGNINKPLHNSPCIHWILLGIFRFVIGIASGLILSVSLLRSNGNNLYSYHIWISILHTVYFMLISYCTLLCLDKTNITTNIICLIIWILYQMQLCLSFCICLFSWLYLYFMCSTVNNFKQNVQINEDLTIVSFNFLFVFTDFLINDIPLRFHYGVCVVTFSLIYILFVWFMYINNSSNPDLYDFLDPSQQINSLFYISWVSAHFFMWIFVYYLSYIKMNCCRKNKAFESQININNMGKSMPPAVTQDNIENSKQNSNDQEQLKLNNDNSISQLSQIKPNLKKNMYVSVPDIMIPNETVDDEDLKDDLDIPTSNHTTLTARFLQLTLTENSNIYQQANDKSSESDSYYTEYKDEEEKIGQCANSYGSSQFTISFRDRMKSVTVSGLDLDNKQSPTSDTFTNKRGRIEQELIDTEESYLNGLCVLFDEFITPIFQQKMIDEKYRNKITCNIPELIKFHQIFLDELRKGPISEVFQKRSDFFKMYIPYITEYPSILDIFGRFNKNKQLRMYLAAKRRENKPLTNHLILPIQRIPRYMLLLSELRKNTSQSNYNDYRDINDALKKVELICAEINEKQREIENMSQCLQITETLKYLKINIVQPTRKYINHFIFRRKYDARNRQFFLFNDIIILANIKWEAKRVIKLVKFEVKKPSNNLEEVLINIVGDNEPVYYCSTNDINEKDKHLDVSNCNLFCELINKYRNKLYQNGMERQKTAQSRSCATNNCNRNGSMELLIHEKEEQQKLKKWKQSSAKGKKDKVLKILGT